MKHAKTVLLAGAMVGLVGCATAPKVVVVDPVGPEPTEVSQGTGKGSLVIYSARALADVDINEVEWRWNNDFGRNEFLYEPAHTGYTIYAQNGDVVKRVRNAREQNDDIPTLVDLAPGSYHVQAEGINCDGSRVQLLIPVVVKSGQMTLAHLEGGWQPPPDYKATEVARLPCGKIIGWRATEPGLASSHVSSVSN